MPSEGEHARIGDSDLKITYKQTFPFRVTLGMDDSGSKSTGKWQGFAALSWDNVFSANDLFYTSFTHSIKRHTDNDGRRANKSIGFYYSVPFGYWQLFASFYKNRYHQEMRSAFNIAIFIQAGVSILI